MKMARTRDLADVLRARLAADSVLREAVAEESFNADVAMKVYEARKEAGLTQKQLADKVGTTQSVIARIEDADYDGHSLNLLRRITQALGKRLLVEFLAPAASSRRSESARHVKTRNARDRRPKKGRQGKLVKNSSRV
jgi:transcriptional regulator with XRE-family HTH domain